MKYNWELFGQKFGLYNTPGFYYSPLPDFEEVASGPDPYVMPATSFQSEHAGLDLNEEVQVKIVSDFLELEEHFPYNPDHKESPKLHYHTNQGMFPLGDAYLLYSMLYTFSPKNVIEAGAGFSSGVMLDFNESVPEKRVNLSFIEPYPERLLPMLTSGQRDFLIQQDLQQVDLTFFEQLVPGDFFFIDSSHISKHKSDVNYILFKVLPRLPAGVYIHFHDIFASFDYPIAWYKEGRAWNEAFILKAFLQYNNSFEIILFNDFVHRKRPDLFSQTKCFTNGGSLWLRKTK